VTVFTEDETETVTGDDYNSFTIIAKSVDENLTSSDELNKLVIRLLGIDSLSDSDNVITQYNFNNIILENLTINDNFIFGLVELVNEVLSVEDESSYLYRCLIAISEDLDIQEIPNNKFVMLESVIDALQITSILLRQVGLSATESLSAIDSVEFFLKIIKQINEVFTVSDDSSTSLSIFAVLSDSLAFEETATTKQLFTQIITESLSTFGNIYIDGSSGTSILIGETRFSSARSAISGDEIVVTYQINITGSV